MPTPHKPLIGLTARRGDAAWTSENTRHYIDVLNDYGADWVILSPDTPVTLPDGAVYTPDARGRLPLAALDQLDGLLLTGGGDVDPRYFGAPLAGANPKAIDPKRDELELNLTRRALGLDLPVFGICRGCQVMNVAAGGGMIQDFDGHRSPKDDPFYHDVIFDRGSRLYQTVGRDALAVNTSITRDWTGRAWLRLSAWPAWPTRTAGWWRPSKPASRHGRSASSGTRSASSSWMTPTAGCGRGFWTRAGRSGRGVVLTQRRRGAKERREKQRKARNLCVSLRLCASASNFFKESENYEPIT
jgi:putative glutamine amidotransferase